MSGDILAEIVLAYTAPDPLGEPPADFQGVNTYVRTPDDRVQELGWQFYSGDPGGDGEVRLRLPYPAQAETWRFYLAARSEVIENKLDLEATPSIDVNVPADPFTGNAPDVPLFWAGISNGDGTFTREMYWDSRREKLLIDWAAVRPEQTVDWSGLKVYIRTPDGQGGYVYFEATGLYGPEAFEERQGTYVLYQQIAVEPESIPDPPQQWRFIAVSYDREGHRNEDASGNPTGPAIDLTTLPKADDPLNFTAAVEYATSEAGDQTFRFWGSWQNPPMPRYKGVRVVARWAGPPEVDVVLALEQEGSSSFRTDSWTVQPGARAVTLYAQAIYGDESLKPITPSTPHVDLIVEPQTGPAGREYAPLVSAFTASVIEATNEAGVQLYGFSGSWTNPTDRSKFRGVKLVARPSGGDGTTDRILAIETEGATNFRTDLWPKPQTAETWTIYAVSLDANNRANSIVAGTTPAQVLQVVPGASGTLKGGRIDPTTLGGGLQVISDQLQAKISTALEIAADAIGVKLGAAMQTVENALTVKLGSALEIAADAIGVKLGAAMQ
ncbi:MAG: hypothetical protein ACUVX1_17405, partial [Chloroflexota bacterium]